MNSQNAQRPTNANFAQPRESVGSLPTPRQGPRPPEGHSQFHIYRTERVNLTSTLFGGGDWHWRLTGSSGTVIADCGGYPNEAQCLAAVDALRADAAVAKLVKHPEFTDLSLNARRN